MKQLLLMITAVAISFTAGLSASGNRDLIFDAHSAETMRELASSDLTLKGSSPLRYLGSSQQWHIFGETLTSTEGGRPFDNTFAYRVSRENIKVINGWSLNGNNDHYRIHVTSCPTISIKEAENIIEISLHKQSDNQCIHRLSNDIH
jgi:hypothetical protein